LVYIQISGRNLGKSLKESDVTDVDASENGSTEAMKANYFLKKKRLILTEGHLESWSIPREQY
jgi:hypothetical protein